MTRCPRKFMQHIPWVFSFHGTRNLGGRVWSVEAYRCMQEFCTRMMTKCPRKFMQHIPLSFFISWDSKFGWQSIICRSLSLHARIYPLNFSFHGIKILRNRLLSVVPCWPVGALVRGVPSVVRDGETELGKLATCLSCWLVSSWKSHKHLCSH